jgi:hypothetical protein
MARKERVKTFFDGSPRPDWASLEFELSEVESRVNGRHELGEKDKVGGERTDSAEGILVPITTRGRGATPGPPDFDTSETVFDKGHVLALSLGGPNQQYNIIPQPWRSNRRVNPFLNDAKVRHLLWREFEWYSIYCALLARGAMSPPPPTPESSINMRTLGPGRVQINDLVLELPAVDDYGRGGKYERESAWIVVWRGEFKYPRATTAAAAAATIKLSARWMRGSKRGQEVEIGTAAFKFDFVSADFMELEQKQDQPFIDAALRLEKEEHWDGSLRSRGWGNPQ